MSHIVSSSISLCDIDIRPVSEAEMKYFFRICTTILSLLVEQA